jgi:DNA-binding Lrp family transcriptional regulator
VCVIDELDRRLLAALRVNSRTPVAVLARELGVNRATVTGRIDRLVRDGVIETFTVRMSDEVDRDTVRGITMVALEPRSGQDAVRTIRGFPEVERLHSTVGRWDLVVQLGAPTLSAFDVALERVRAVPGVTDTETSVLFNSLTGHEWW